MKKRILGLLVVLCMLTAFVPCIGATEIVDSGTCGDNLTWTLDSDGTLKINGTGNMQDYGTTSSRDPYPVSPFYKKRTEIKNVIIENGIINISQCAFYECKNLINVNIPNSVTSIGSSAFQYCENLTNVNIPDDVTNIGDRAFLGCENLTCITIQGGVTSINDGTFCDCYRLTSILLPNSVTSIGYFAFRGCSSLKNITIPNGVTYIDQDVFEHCSSLTSITIPASVTRIGYDAFYGCWNLTDIYYEGTEKQWSSITSTANGLITPNIHYNSPIHENNLQVFVSPPSDWAKSDIDKAIELGLIPEELQTEWQTPITRFDFCKLAQRLYEKMIADGNAQIVAPNGSFSDTADMSDADKRIIGTAAALGIVSGYEDGTFRPYNEITRQEAAIMLMRAARKFGYGEPLSLFAEFTDCTDDWAMEGIEYCYNAGIMKGTSETYQSTGVTDGHYIVEFSPKATYTREQAMVTFYRLYSSYKPVNDDEFVPLGGYPGALKDYEKAAEKYEKAVIEAVNRDKQKENLKKNMIAAMKEHWILSDSSGKKDIPDDVYEAMYLFTCTLNDFKVISKDADWSKMIDQISGSIDMTATTLSNIGHGKRKYSVNGTDITVDATVTVGKSGFGTVSWNGNSAVFSSNPKETLGTTQELVKQCIDLVEDIYTDEFEDVTKELTGYSNVREFLEKKLSKHLNNFMKETGKGDFNELAGHIGETLRLAESITISQDADDLLAQMQKLSKKDLLSDTSLTDIMVKEALSDLKKAETKLIREAEKKIYE